ncbi:MAG TPA: ATP-binding cassette domain-containing protein [Bacillota bacterium]|nr:ATP-binding cassette domain-containing protein [Bacillota bacterium]HPT67721.1 ATP-binding cassette domain-containing protein [Bacillota bacterium]
MNSLIKIEGLSFTYPGAQKAALSRVDLAIGQGEFVGITGPAGAGKSTLLLCINGIIPHFQEGEVVGSVRFQGVDTFETSCRDLARSIGSVFEDPEAQIVAMTVEEELAFGLENLNIPPAEMEERIAWALKMTGIESLRYRSTAQLSGGQKQRVAIAAAIALRPRVLLLDEPTSELDPVGTDEVFKVLRHLNRDLGITVVVVEQKLDVLMEHVNRLVIMDQGRVWADLPPRQVLAQPELLDEIGLCVPPVGRLAHRLRQAGLLGGELPLTVEEAFRGLAGLVGG